MCLCSMRHRQLEQADAPSRPSRRFLLSVLTGILLILLLLTVMPLHAMAAARHASPVGSPLSPTTSSPGATPAMRQALKRQIKVTHHQPNQPRTLTPSALNLPPYNNIGTSDDRNMFAGNFDGGEASYSTQALQAAGVVPGQNLLYDTITYTWPAATAGTANNYQANGQVIPVLQVNNAPTLGFLGAASNGASSGTATITYTDGTTQTITLGFTDWAIASTSFGNTIAVTTSYRNSQDGKQSQNFYLFSAEFALTAGKTVQSVTLPTTVTGGQLHVFAVGVSWPVPNNVGVTNDNNRNPGNFDGQNNSYSAQALQDDGITAGHPVVTMDGLNFPWPSASPGSLNNYQASGQKLYVEPVPNATTLGFLGAASNGASSGTATITYTDASTQTFPLGFTDWTSSTLLFGNTIAATMSYRNQVGGQQTINTYLFTAEVGLTVGKTIQSVTLPSTVSGGQLHVFAVSTTSATLNNMGVSDDGNLSGANFDGQQFSYSAQALQGAITISGQSLIYDGIVYPWPTPMVGTATNYIANGQILPVTPVANAVTLGVLGAATNGTGSGTATITYTDNSTQTFPLSFADWTASTPLSGETVVASMSYRNRSTGRDATSVSLFNTEVAFTPGKTIRSVTLPTTVTGGQLHIFAVGIRSSYNNIGISDNTTLTSANFDAGGHSYSAQDFSDPNGPGWNPGDTLTYNGMNLTWPNVPAGADDNYVAAGQTLSMTPVPQANTIGFVGSATGGGNTGSTGTVTLTYTDHSTQSIALTMNDWVLNLGRATPAPGDRLFAVLPHQNTLQGQQNISTYLFYTEFALQAGKTLQSVTLPSAVTQGQIHIFMIGTRAGNTYLNNVGTSDDTTPAFASLDGGTHSYSIQALEGAHLIAGQTVLVQGVSFAWPASYSVIPDNYQAAGQTIGATPVAGANTLAFLGAATNGPSSGTVTITYTDATTQTFSLGFSDWTLNAGTSTVSFGNVTAASMPYRNTASGRDNTQTYLFYAEVGLTAGKTIQSVTLPTTVNQGQLHVFAVGTR